jgi:hypothetical protein
MRTARLAMRGPEGGQALAEFLALALVLVPFFLLLPMIAKYQDIAHATEMAGRYVAFDATVRNEATGGWKPNDQLAGEVQRRYFSNPAAPIKTGDTPGDFKAHQNLFWRDPLDNALIRSFNADIAVSYGEGRSSSRAAGYKGGSDGVPFLGSESFLGLESPGVFRGNVSVSVANLPESLVGPTKSYDGLKAINLVIRRHTALVPDAWTAANTNAITGRLGSSKAIPINPGILLAPLSGVINAGAVVMEGLPGSCGMHCGPKLGELEYWREAVPADRLPPYTRQP